MKQRIQFGTKQIDFTLTFVERRSLAIKVHPSLKVEALAPFGSDIKKVLAKIKSKAPWILKHIEQFKTYRPGTPPRRFVNGETHLYLGRQYRLRIVPDAINTIKAYRGQLFIHASDTSKPALEKQLQQWYMQKATLVFTEMINEILPQFKKYKIKQPVLKIRKMSKRWGSCTPGGKIILNTELIKAPKGSIEYVVTHELAHLVHHNHTKPFFDLQNKMMPDWRKWKDRLEYFMA